MKVRSFCEFNKQTKLQQQNKLELLHFENNICKLLILLAKQVGSYENAVSMALEQSILHEN